MKNEKGITLIALIITIIVMLILVAVTINVALNGGIFDKAKDATQKTSREVEREQIVAAMIGAYDNNGNFVKANVELPEGASWCDKNGTLSAQGNYVVTKNNEKFYVSPTDGTVLDEELIDDLILTEKTLASRIDENVDEDVRVCLILESEAVSIYYTESLTNPGKETVQLIVTDSVENEEFRLYYWFCNNSTATLFNNENNITSAKANQWFEFKVDPDSLTPYSGSCPIEFTEEQLQNNSYLKRIHDSFNNEN